MATGWLRGRVKAVTSGDCLVIVGNVKAGPPPEKTITLASLMAPKLARRDTRDEAFAWNAREYLRQKCIGQEVVFKVDYAVPSINREFGSVFMGSTNMALDVVTAGWAKVRPPVPNSTDVSPYLEQLLKAEEQAKEQGVGMWTKEPGAAEASIRDLPPSGVGQDSGFDAAALLETHRGLTLTAIVEQVRDGSTVRVFLLPSFQFVQVYIAGVQSPAVGRKLVSDPAAEEAASTAAAANGVAGLSLAGAAPGAPGADSGPPSAAQRLAASADKEKERTESVAEPYALEAKHYTEMKCLHREVRVVLEGVDGRYSNLVGSLHYPDPQGGAVKNLALELVTLGLGKVVEWSANMLEAGAKASLKNAELEAKRQRLRLWANFVVPASASTAVKDDSFTGHVVEVVSGDCLIVAEDLPGAEWGPERRVNLSSIRARKMGNPRREEKPEPYAREAKEFLRQRLVGQQVKVTMEYSRKMPAAEEGGPDGRTMTFGTVMLLAPGKLSEGSDAAPAAQPAANGSAGAAGAPIPLNVAELVVGRGFATVVRHRDFEERSAHYEALQAAEQRAIKGKRNLHSSKEPPVNNVNDLSLQGATNRAKNFLPFLQRARRLAAMVEYVLSGHRFKLLIPKESCTVAFSLAGVRCPGRGEPFSEQAIAFMRRRIMQQDVEIEVETVDKTGTFIGSLWVKRNNAGVLLLQAGLAKLHPSFSSDRTAEGPALQAAERKAKDARLGVWKDFVEGADKAEEAASSSGPLGSATWGTGAAQQGKQEVMQVQVTEVLGGGRFYAVEAAAGALGRMEEALKQLGLGDALVKAPTPGTFVPKRGEIVLSQFSADKSWARAMVVAVPPEATPQKASEYTVFYVDYGNQEVVPFSSLRAMTAAGGALPVVPVRGDCPGLAQLCQLAHVKVPLLEEDFGVEAAQKLQELGVGRTLLLRLEQRDASGGRAKGQNTGTCWLVTLVDSEATLSVNAAMLQAGLARLEKRSGREMARNATLSAAVDSLREHQEVARKQRLNMWEYGDVESDDEDDRRGRPPPRR